MTAPSQPDNAPPGGDTDDRELADYLAGQDPLDAEAALWLARRLDGLTAAEEIELRAWLAGNSARGAKLDQLAGVWGQLGDLPPGDIATLKAALPSAQAFAPMRELAPQAAPPRVATPHRPDQPDRLAWLLDWKRLIPRFAFAGMVAMVIGSGWMSWHHWLQQPTYTQSFATARGQQLTASLPDGSTLMLDTATRLDVKLYRQRREVHLAQGQALFEVRGDPHRPFHVLAGPLRVSVLGTRFTVRHISAGLAAGTVGVTVEEGRVRVSQVSDETDPGRELTAGAGVVLTAEQRVSADAHGNLGAVVHTKPEAEQAWREGRVVFDGTPLAEAIAEIERYVATGLVIDDPAVASLRLNGSFDLRQAHTFKRVLPLALPVRLVERGHVTEIVAR